MNALRPSAKVGIVFLGLIIAFVIAWIADDLRQLATQGPDAQASAGMYAFGDLILGVGVFGLSAFVPLALGLFWLRPIILFWAVLTWSALVFAATGALAVVASAWFGRTAGGNWIMLLSVARIGIMPLSALALAICGLFAPRPRYRWLLLAVAITDGALFTGFFAKTFLLSHFATQ